MKIFKNSVWYIPFCLIVSLGIVYLFTPSISMNAAPAAAEQSQTASGYNYFPGAAITEIYRLALRPDDMLLEGIRELIEKENIQDELFRFKSMWLLVPIYSMTQRKEKQDLAINIPKHFFLLLEKKMGEERFCSFQAYLLERRSAYEGIYTSTSPDTLAQCTYLFLGLAFSNMVVYSAEDCIDNKIPVLSHHLFLKVRERLEKVAEEIEVFMKELLK